MTTTSDAKVDPRILNWEISPLKSERVVGLRAAAREALHTPIVCSSRAKLYGEAWRANDGDAWIVRRAKAYRHVLSNIPIRIGDGELIVGSQTKSVVGSSIAVEFDPYVALELAEGGGQVAARSESQISFASPEDVEGLAGEARYWRGRSTIDKVEEALQRKFGNLHNELCSARIGAVGSRMASNNAMVRMADYAKVLTVGLRGIIQEIDSELAALNYSAGVADADRADEWEAMRIALEGLIIFSHRHAQLAREMAKSAKDSARKRELEEIAAVCDRVPEMPARSFREALQATWFTYLAMNLELVAWNESAGRIDQYLYPYFRRDMDEGRLTLEDAAEGLAALWIKFGSLTLVKTKYGREADGGSHLSHVTCGGVRRDGTPAENELTWLLLLVVGDLKVAYPSLFFRVHPNTPPELIAHAVESNRRHGAGVPAFHNDAPAIDKLMSRGVTLEDARDYWQTGCSMTHAPGAATRGNFHINCAKVLEIALHQGKDPATGKQWGPVAGAPGSYGTWDDVNQGFKAYMEYFANLLASMGAVSYPTQTRHWGTPFIDALTPDCIHKGRGITEGGLRYPDRLPSVDQGGMINAADSLLVLKHLVFDEKVVTLDELLAALAANWQGYEELRKKALAVPKYGNDDDAADWLAQDVWVWTANAVIEAFKRANGGRVPHLHRQGASLHYYRGKGVGATPDGRLAGEPLAEGSVSPMRGRDTQGPTAVANSVCKLDHLASDNNVWNMRIMPRTVRSQEGKRKLASLIRTAFDNGAYQIQINMVDAETLLEAQRHPEQHTDLIVRVGGYSAHFVDLPRKLQDEIIGRTEHGM